jgi:hypothetical protein
MQDLFKSNVEKLSFSTNSFDPASREASIRLLWMGMVEVQYDEDQLLLPTYRKYLPAIRAATAASR